MKNLLVSTLLLIWFVAPSKGQTIYLEQDFASGTGTAYELIAAYLGMFLGQPSGIIMFMTSYAAE